MDKTKLNPIAIAEIFAIDRTNIGVYVAVYQAAVRLHALESTDLKQSIHRVVKEINVPVSIDYHFFERALPCVINQHGKDEIHVIGEFNWVLVVLPESTAQNETYTTEKLEAQSELNKIVTELTPRGPEDFGGSDYPDGFKPTFSDVVIPDPELEKAISVMCLCDEPPRYCNKNCPIHGKNPILGSEHLAREFMASKKSEREMHIGDACNCASDQYGHATNPNCCIHGEYNRNWIFIDDYNDNAATFKCISCDKTIQIASAKCSECVHIALSFEELRDVNLRRCMKWHPEGIASWSVSDWAVAMAGEAGEVCNQVKKLRRDEDAIRGNKDGKWIFERYDEIGKEIADTVIYCDLLASRLGLSLQDLVREKFNEVSVRNEFDERL